MTRRRKRDPRFSLEVIFEPQRGGQDALTDAYRHLPPILSRPARLPPVGRTREEMSDAKPRNGVKADTARNLDPDGNLRQGVLRSAS